MSDTSYGAYDRRRGDSGFHLLNRILIIAIIVAICIGGVVASVPVFKQYREQNERIDQLQKSLEREKALHARRIREERLLRNDPAYLEIVSRDRLDVMKPGETIIHLDPPRASAAPVAPRPKKSDTTDKTGGL